MSWFDRQAIPLAPTVRLVGSRRGEEDQHLEPLGDGMEAMFYLRLDEDDASRLDGLILVSDAQNGTATNNAVEPWSHGGHLDVSALVTQTQG